MDIVDGIADQQRGRDYGDALTQQFDTLLANVKGAADDDVVDRRLAHLDEHLGIDLGRVLTVYLTVQASRAAIAQFSGDLRIERQWHSIRSGSGGKSFLEGVDIRQGWPARFLRRHTGRDS